MKGHLPFLFKPPLLPRALASSFRKHPCHCESPLPPCDLTPLHLIPSPAHITSRRCTSCPLRAQTQGSSFISNMARTRGASPAPSLRRTTRQRASSAQVPSDSPSQATEAPRIPPFEGGVAIGTSSPAPQRRYETRRPPTTPRATTSHPESSVRCPPTKRAKTSGPRESSKAFEQPTDSELPIDLLLESIIRRPIVTTPLIEGNSDCRVRPFHSKLYFDQETMRQQPKLRDSYGLL